MLSACNKVDLNGHWHMDYEYTESREYIALDIIDDSIVAVDQRSFIWSYSGFISTKERVLDLPIGCGYGVFDLKMINADKIRLTQRETGKIYTAKRCEFSTCCNHLEERMKNLKIEVRLTDNNKIDEKELIKLPFDYEISFVYGIPRERYQGISGDSIRLQLNNKFAKTSDIPIYLGYRLLDETMDRNELNYKIIADKETPLDTIYLAIRMIKKQGIEKVYVSTGFDEEEEDLDGFLYVESSKIDFTNTEQTWGAYLTSGK